MEKLHIEKWSSDTHLTEIHYFLDDKANDYLCGYNPMKISKKTWGKILALIKKEVTN